MSTGLGRDAVAGAVEVLAAGVVEAGLAEAGLMAVGVPVELGVGGTVAAGDVLGELPPEQALNKASNTTPTTNLDWLATAGLYRPKAGGTAGVS